MCVGLGLPAYVYVHVLTSCLPRFLIYIHTYIPSLLAACPLPRYLYITICMHAYSARAPDYPLALPLPPSPGRDTHIHIYTYIYTRPPGRLPCAMTLLSAMCLQPDTHTCMSIYHKCMYTHTLYIRLSCCAPCSLFCGIAMLSSRWATLCAGPPSPSPPPDDSSPPPFSPPPDAPGNSGYSLYAVPFANTHALGSLLSRELLLWLLPCRETASLYAQHL